MLSVHYQIALIHALCVPLAVALTAALNTFVIAILPSYKLLAEAIPSLLLCSLLPTVRSKRTLW